ncbi:Uncharacterised protein [Bordetella pertussis]|nr:Uncharacterised protein [Bordetella pertussis]
MALHFTAPALGDRYVQGREGNHRHPEDKRHQRHEALRIWFEGRAFM